MLISERLGAALQVPGDCSRTGEGLGAQTSPHHGTPGPVHGTVPTGAPPPPSPEVCQHGAGGSASLAMAPGCHRGLGTRLPVPSLDVFPADFYFSAPLPALPFASHVSRTGTLTGAVASLCGQAWVPLPATPRGLWPGGFSRAESRKRETAAFGALDPDLDLVVKEMQSGPGRVARGLSDAERPGVQEVLGGTAHGGDGDRDGDGDRLAAFPPGSSRKERAEQDRGQIVAACHKRVSIRIWKLPSMPHKQFHPNI